MTKSTSPAAHINNTMSFCINVCSMKYIFLPHLSPCLACKSIKQNVQIGCGRFIKSYIVYSGCNVMYNGAQTGQWTDSLRCRPLVWGISFGSRHHFVFILLRNQTLMRHFLGNQLGCRMNFVELKNPCDRIYVAKTKTQTCQSQDNHALKYTLLCS